MNAQALRNPVVQIMASIFLFTFLLGMLGIYLFDTFTNRMTSAFVTTALGSGIAYALTILGIQHGATITAQAATELAPSNNGTPNGTTKAPVNKTGGTKDHG